MAVNNARLVGAILLLAMAANVHASVCKELTCPTDSGYFAHPRSCVAYVKCVQGKAFLEECPANLHYNSASGMCDHPENSQCVEEEKLKSTSCDLTAYHQLRTVSVPVPGIECDCGDCCRKANPLDCNSYYECDENGDAYEKTCGLNLVYNPVKEDCDLATNYVCPELPSCNCKCRYPADGECDAFYRCEEVGQPVSKEYCTEGLKFNPETEQCDNADNVDCPAAPDPTLSSPEECKDLKSDCQFWVANGDCICDTFKSGDCSWQHYVQTNCPKTCKLERCNESPSSDEPSPNPLPTESPPMDCEIDCSQGQYHRHPTDCTKFIQCAPYGPQEMPCGAGTRWDQDLLTCNHAAQTECVTGQYKDAEGNNCGGGDDPEVSSGPAPTLPSTGGCIDLKSDCKYWVANGDCICDEFKSGDCSWQYYVQNNCPSTCKLERCNESPLSTEPPTECDLKCPEENGEFAHPRDCKKWVHCSHHVPYVKDCPSDLHFDPTKRVCNWAQDTVCIATVESGCDIPIIVTPSPDPLDPPEVCDCECCLRPHPEDCQSYYYCDGANTEFHTCSDGLVFHPENETCVYAADYPECVTFDAPECECDCLYPSPICSEYFQCVNDEPERKVCNGDLLYNPSKKACDNPENVVCTTTASKRSSVGRLIPAIDASECQKLPNGRYANRQNPDDFYHCAGGVSFLLGCQEGGTFSRRTGRCERK